MLFVLSEIHKIVFCFFVIFANGPKQRFGSVRRLTNPNIDSRVNARLIVILQRHTEALQSGCAADQIGSDQILDVNYRPGR